MLEMQKRSLLEAEAGGVAVLLETFIKVVIEGRRILGAGTSFESLMPNKGGVTKPRGEIV